MDELLVLALFGGLAAATGAFATAWLASRRRARDLDRLLGQLGVFDDRLDGVDQRLEDMAGRLDQLVRGQEFLGKLLSRGRSQSRSAVEPPAASPH